MFHGILYDDANIDEPAHRTEEKVMCSNAAGRKLFIDPKYIPTSLNEAIYFINICRYGK